MKIAPLADVKARLSGYLERVASDGPVIIRSRAWTHVERILENCIAT
jgi:hypothetical protein